MNNDSNPCTTGLRKNNNQSIIQEEKQRWIFYLLGVLFFYPILYLVSLNGITIYENSEYILDLFCNDSLGNCTQDNSYHFRYYSLLLTAIFKSLFYTGLLILAAFLTYKKIAKSNINKIFFVFTLRYLLAASPILLFYIYKTISGFIAGGESGGFSAAYAIATTIDTLIYILPVIFLSLLLFFWLKGKKIHAISLFCIGLITLTFYTFTQVIIGGCYYRDKECILHNIRTESQDVDFCAKSHDPSDCYKRIVLSSEDPDPSLCEKITISNSPNKKRYYINKNTCYEKLAIETKDISFCDKMIPKSLDSKIHDSKENCYARINFELAQEKNDLSFCDKIPPNVYFAASSDPTMQAKATDPLVSLVDCYLKIILAVDNPLLCEKLTSKTPGFAGTNRERCYFYLGKITEDCSLIPEDNNRSLSKASCEKDLEREF